tara:strand:- start:6 stop:452 length:447 start_codon:yes stop_codon:yes gene_type:complete
MDIILYNQFDINKLNINYNQILYNDNILYLQTPYIYDFSFVNINNQQYIEFKFDNNNSKHLTFLTLLKSIESKISNSNFKLNTQIYCDILYNKSIKVKLSNVSEFYNFNKESIDINAINNSKIITILMFDNKNNTKYSWFLYQLMQKN